MPTYRLAWLLLIAVLLFASSATAQPPDALPSAPHGATYYLLRAFLSLTLIVALIYAIYFGLRRLSYSGGVGVADERLQVLHRRHLGGGRWIYAIRAADRVLIVGGGADGLRTLAEMPAEQYQDQVTDCERDRADANN